MNIKKRGGVEVGAGKGASSPLGSGALPHSTTGPPLLQHSTCKHIREVIGHEAEDARLATNAGGEPGADGAPHGPAAAARSVVVSAAGGDSNPSVVKKISLAQAWTVTTDPTGWMLSEK